MKPAKKRADLSQTNFAPLIESLASHFKLTLSQDVLQRLFRYVEGIAIWNRRHNLTAAATPQELLEISLADSFLLCSRTWPESLNVVDIGSGAGAPMIGWLLCAPTIKCTCVEKAEKRQAFLHWMSGLLGLEQRLKIVSTIKRLDPQLTFDLASSRATFAPRLWLELAQSLAPRALVFLSKKGLDLQDHQIEWELDYTLPWSKKSRTLSLVSFRR